MSSEVSTVRSFEFEFDHEWLAFRREHGFGASESAAFFPPGKWKKWRSGADVVAAKLRQESEEQKRSLKIRELLEAGIAANYEHWRGLEVQRPFFVIAPSKRTIFLRTEAPFVLGTPDGWVDEKGHERRLVEFKTAGDSEDWDEKGVPLTYQVQVQQQMYCTGLRDADLAVLFMAREPEFRIYSYVADERFQATLVRRLRAAWETVLARRRGEDVPLPDAGPDDSALLAAACPPVPEKVAIMAPADLELAERWRQRRAEASSYRKIADGWDDLAKADQNALLSRMNGASLATFPNSGLRLVSKLKKRASHTVNDAQWLELKEDKE